MLGLHYNLNAVIEISKMYFIVRLHIFWIHLTTILFLFLNSGISEKF